MRHASKLIIASLGLTFPACALLAWAAPKGPAGEARKSPPAAATTASKPEPADNSYCYACHANYEEEKLTMAHQPAGVGCEKCHGPSVAHSGDEDNITPPDKMYAKADINPFCLGCHAREKLVKDDDHKAFFRDPEPGETCNDCHAKQHRLKVRTRVWDKKTHKLLKDDGVRMMKKKE